MTRELESSLSLVRTVGAGLNVPKEAKTSKNQFQIEPKPNEDMVVNLCFKVESA